MLYVDCYFRTTFIKKYIKDVSDTPNSEIKVQFANNARTVCTAFVMFASRYYQKNLNLSELNTLFKAAQNDKLSDSDVYNIVKNMSGINWILPPDVWANKDQYDDVLYKLFELMIKHGSHDLMMIMRTNDTITASNYLKKDKNYIEILSMNWDYISDSITAIFDALQ